MDKFSGGVCLHLAVHQCHGAGERLLVLVPHAEDGGPGPSQAVGVILPLQLLCRSHGAVLLRVHLDT